MGISASLELGVAAIAVLLVTGDYALRRLQRTGGYGTADTLCSVALGASYLVVWTLARGFVLAAFVWLAATAPTLDWIVDGPFGWVITFIGVDFGYYWFHRCMHRTNMSWAVHAVHHSSRYFNYATALRGSLIEPLIEPWFYVWLLLMGADPLVLITCIAANHAYQFWVHTESIQRGFPFEWLLVTPSHHRVHHACNAHYLDRNFGGVLILWDRLFSTFAEESVLPRYGLVMPVRTVRPLRVLMVPFQRLLAQLRELPSLQAQLQYLFDRPGVGEHLRKH